MILRRRAAAGGGGGGRGEITAYETASEQRGNPSPVSIHYSCHFCMGWVASSMHGQHFQQQSMDQLVMVVNPARSQLNKGKCISP